MGHILPHRRYGFIPCWCWIRLTLLLAAAAGCWLLTNAAAAAYGVTAVGWSYASFQTERLGNRLTAEVRIAELPTAEEQGRFLRTPRGNPAEPPGKTVAKLSVWVRLDLIGRAPIRLESHLWLDPNGGAPFYLTRSRLGMNDYHQRFRFTDEGVYRRQREPLSSAEAAGAPDFWTKIGKHFYAYPAHEKKCPEVYETTSLLYMLSVSAENSLAPVGPLCVFHKRQLHRVSLQADSTEKVFFDFLETHGTKETRRSGATVARRIRLESKPIGSYRGDVEDLFRNGAVLCLSPDGRIPLMISGDMPLIGRVDLKLTEIKFD